MTVEAIVQKIVSNEKAIKKFEAEAEPHLAKQREYVQAAKDARLQAREYQKKADPSLLAAQELRAENQRLKVEAGNELLKEQMH